MKLMPLGLSVGPADGVAEAAAAAAAPASSTTTTSGQLSNRLSPPHKPFKDCPFGGEGNFQAIAS